jgi:HPt (histidine-containing phosphotransfer) domain-containing protein
VAHALKSGARSLCAPQAAAVAFRLETAGRNGDFDNAARLLHELEKQLDAIAPALNQLFP